MTTEYTILRGTTQAVETETSGPPTGDPNDPLLLRTTVYSKLCGNVTGVENRGRGSVLEIRDEGTTVLDEPFWLDITGSGLAASTPDGIGVTLTRSGIPTAAQIFVEAPLLKSYPLLTDAYHTWDVNTITGKTASGTCDFSVKIDGVTVTGLTGTFTSSEQTFTATALYSVAAGQRVSLDFSAISSPADLEATLVSTRTSA
jgi:hypothetical protein